MNERYYSRPWNGLERNFLRALLRAQPGFGGWRLRSGCGLHLTKAQIIGGIKHFELEDDAEFYLNIFGVSAEVVASWRRLQQAKCAA